MIFKSLGCSFEHFYKKKILMSVGSLWDTILLWDSMPIFSYF